MRFWPEAVGALLASDLARSGSETRRFACVRFTPLAGVAAGARQIAGKPCSHALRAEAVYVSYQALIVGGNSISLSRVIGRSRIRLPVAWDTAFATAAASPVMPISPMPRAPNSLSS